MGLLEALNKVKSEKYDPKKDDISSGFQSIPDGTYTVTLTVTLLDFLLFL